MEYCEGGDLGVVIKKCKAEGSWVDEDFVWRVFTQATLALRECHRHKDAAGRLRPVLHRDLKPGT